MSYVYGFVLAVPKDNLAAYRKMARTAGKAWREHGALEYVADSKKKRPFASDRAAYISGCEVTIDGGITARRSVV